MRIHECVREYNSGAKYYECPACGYEFAPSWIPCSERMPELHRDVLVARDTRVIGIAYLEEYAGGKAWSFGIDVVPLSEVMCWMPLPGLEP